VAARAGSFREHAVQAAVRLRMTSAPLDFMSMDPPFWLTNAW